jgi:hypothetical protein
LSSSVLSGDLLASFRAIEASVLQVCAERVK